MHESSLVITRRFEAPVALVWRAWSDPAMLIKWWSPKGFTTPVAKVDFRVGGKYLMCMRSPEGEEFWSTGVYKEIIPHQRMVCTDSFSDADGNVVPPSHYGMQGDTLDEYLITVEFQEDDGSTVMTLTHLGMPAGEMSDMAGTGWNQFFDKLVEALKTA